MLLIKELSPKLNTQKDYSRQTLYVSDSACEYFIIITTYFHFLFVSPRNSLTFIFVLILLIFGLILGVKTCQTHR